jgi:hypothetical protein
MMLSLSQLANGVGANLTRIVSDTSSSNALRADHVGLSPTELSLGCLVQMGKVPQVKTIRGAVHRTNPRIHS